MTQLNQLLAIEKGVKAKATSALTFAYQTVQKTPLLAGISRVYQPLNDDDVTLPAESTLVQTRTTDLIARTLPDLARLFDVTASKDSTNAEASADVVVNGDTLAENLTVPTLLFLEKQLVDLRTFVSKLPTLDPSERWELDPSTGTYRTEVTQTVKTKKIPRVLVKAEATDKHPAQTEVYHEDVPVGTWSTTKFSGALPAEVVRAYTQRVDLLLEAVKVARESANMQTVEDRKIGNDLLSYVFGTV